VRRGLIEKKFLYKITGMGKIHSAGNWLIKVQGNEHPPVHVHVLHPDGKAIIEVDGTVINSGIPAKVITEAVTWVLANVDAVRAEWQRMNNPPVQGVSKP